MSSTGNTPDPSASGTDKTRLTNSPAWSAPTTPPPSRTDPMPGAPTANSPYGPGNEPPGPDMLPPSLQGRYKLIHTLGQGGFATVYLADDSVLDQQVAIKVLRLGLASRNDRDRFLLEARIGAKLRHPNIVTVFDIMQTSDGLQMVMEYYPGGTLTERLRSKGPLHPRTAIDYTRQVAQALAYAHRHNVIHRDVKPANIFLAGEGMIKLGDFGIATHSDTHEFTQTGMIIGTPLYMPPEQSADSRDVDPRTDIYALGLTLYHMLTGRPPRVVDLESIPEAFRSLIKQSTAHDRNERLVSAEQFIAMLDQLQPLVGPGRPGSVAGGAYGDNPSFSSTPSQTLTPGPSYYGPGSDSQDAPLPTPAPGAVIEASPTPQPAPSQPPRRSTRAAQEQSTQTQPQHPLPAPSRPAAVPSPPEPRRRRGWLWLGGAALATAGFAGYLLMNANGGFNFVAEKSPAATPTPAATATPAPTPPPPLAPPLPRERKGPFKAKADRKMQSVREDVRKRMEARREAQLTPTMAPTPTPRPTTTPTPALDDMTRIDQAYAQCMETHPGVKNALEIIREKGGKEMPQQMRQFALQQAQTTILDALKKNPEDPILNLIVGNLYLKVGNSQLARACFERAIQSDRQAGSPLGLSMEKIQMILGQNRLQGER